jgi:histidinol-phosphate aminotransferase
MSILNLVRPELLSTPVYISEREAENRLHANELPWSPIAESSYNCYPNYEEQLRVTEQLARRYQVKSPQIILTRGSDEGIDLITRLFLTARKDAFLYFPPTFSMYAFYVRLQQAQLLECVLDSTDHFALSIEKINTCWQPNCKIIMLCNPNNPTGTLLDLEFIASVCETYRNRSIIVVDEAYIEFADCASAATLINQYDNLIVLRTLSKAYGLAGIRLGSIIAQEAIINAISKITAPYTISSTTLDIAQQALMHDEWFRSAIKKIQVERDKLVIKLNQLNWIETIYPSKTNFILIKTPYAQAIAAYLFANKITIRQFSSNSLLHQHIRITVGSEEQNILLMGTLSSFNTANY